MNHTNFKKRSMISGKENVMSIPLPPDRFAKRYSAWMKGTLIQDAFPMLSREMREFIQSGITPDEWDEVFGNDEDDD